MADVSQSLAISVADASKTQYPCDPVLSEGASHQVICDLHGDSVIFDLTGQNLPDSMLVLTESDPSTATFDTLEQLN